MEAELRKSDDAASDNNNSKDDEYDVNYQSVLDQKEAQGRRIRTAAQNRRQRRPASKEGRQANEDAGQPSPGGQTTDALPARQRGEGAEGGRGDRSRGASVYQSKFRSAPPPEGVGAAFVPGPARRDRENVEGGRGVEQHVSTSSLLSKEPSMHSASSSQRFGGSGRDVVATAYVVPTSGSEKPLNHNHDGDPSVSTTPQGESSSTDEHVVYKAQPVSRRWQWIQTHSRSLLLLAIGFVIFCVAVVVLIFLFLVNDDANNNNNDDANDVGSGTVRTTDYCQQAQGCQMVETLQDEISRLLNFSDLPSNDTVFNQSKHWILDDTRLLCPPAVLVCDEARHTTSIYQRWALAVFAFSASFGEDDWLDKDTNECDWQGVDCDTDTNHLHTLLLPQSGLKGTLSEETFRLLPKLKYLDLSDNFLSGRVPTSLWDSTELQSLSLAHNVLGGTLPSTLPTSVERMELQFNMLEGTMLLGSNLRTLILTSNLLTGSLPTTIGTDMPHMEFVRVDDNFFHQQIPQSCDKWSQLTLLSVQRNQFTGSIPAGLCTLIESGGIFAGSNNGGRRRRLTANCKDNTNGEVLFPISNCTCCTCFDGSGGQYASPPQCNPIRNNTILQDERRRRRRLQQGDSSATAVDQIDEDAFLVELIDSISHPEALQNSTTPQAIAREWMLNEDQYWRTLLQVAINETTTTEFILQRFVLAVLYFATGGPETWHQCSERSTTSCPSPSQRFLNTTTSECDWFGVVCVNSADGRVDQLQLDKNGLSGFVPMREISHLSCMHELHLASNNLSRIEEAPALANLSTPILVFDLANNQLGRVPLPPPVFALENLRILRMNKNEYLGELSSRVQNLQALRELNLTNNRMNETLPQELGLLQNLVVVAVDDNDFRGEIPQSVCENRFELGGYLEEIVADCDSDFVTCCPSTNVSSFL